MSSLVNNPENSRVVTSLPFVSPKRIEAIAKRESKGDKFNTGSDYEDEGALFLEGTSVSVTDVVRHPFAGGVQQGIIPDMTTDEIFGLRNPDESAQGELTYLREGVVVEIDAKLLDAQEDSKGNVSFKETHYKSMKEWIGGEHYRSLRESKMRLRSTVETVKRDYYDKDKTGIVVDPAFSSQFATADEMVIAKLKESNGFDDSFSLDAGENGNGDFIPLMSGPYNKQLYWTDYLDQHAKAFQAWTHNPIAKRIVKTLVRFVLGKGVKISVIRADRASGKTEQQPAANGQTDTFDLCEDWRMEAQAVLDDHWRRNDMNWRAKQILQDLIIMGEQFVRYFEVAEGLKVRQIDPSTVWEVVSDPDDCETEFYLHQQYPTRYQWYVQLPIPTIKYIIRQVPADVYYHMKINTVSGEMRGRSDLFVILGWLKRLKEFATDRVIRNKMANLFVLDIAVEGGQAEVTAAQNQFATPPTPGSMYIHNKASEIKGIAAEVGAGEVVADWEMLLTIIACGAGLSQEYLGLPIAGSKAGALIGTEPDIKTFEDYQEYLEGYFTQDANRCFKRAVALGKLPSNLEIKVECSFPSLAEENRSEKLKDLAFSESMSYISHKRASDMAAKELRITTYDYDEEMEQVVQEDVQKEVLLNSAYAQITKGTDSGAAGKADSGGSVGKDGLGMGAMDAPPKGTSGGATGQSAGDVSASVRETDDRKPGWNGRDPLDVRESIIRESQKFKLRKRLRTPKISESAKTLRQELEAEVPGLGSRKTMLNRTKYRQSTPDKVRDQKDMSRGEKITKTRRAIRGNYNESKFPKLLRHVSDAEILSKESQTKSKK